MENVNSCFEVLSDPTRMQILSILSEGKKLRSWLQKQKAKEESTPLTQDVHDDLQEVARRKNEFEKLVEPLKKSLEAAAAKKKKAKKKKMQKLRSHISPLMKACQLMLRSF